MGKKSKPWNFKARRRDRVRAISRHIIFCEDKKSGADYLRAYKVRPDFAEVQVYGGQGNTDGVVEAALAYREKLIQNKTPFAVIWCVFDRDSFPVGDFNRAFEIARPYREVRVIWANECFEIWYLLHFHFRNTPIGRDELKKVLSEDRHLGRKYEKFDDSIFELLKDRIPEALKNARRLEAHYNGRVNPAQDNPSTNLHVLIEALLALQALE